MQLQLRYVAGEIDQAQVHDELMRRYRPDIAPAANVRPLPPGRVYSCAAEMAALLVEMNELPPYVPYLVMDETLPLPEL